MTWGDALATVKPAPPPDRWYVPTTSEEATVLLTLIARAKPSVRLVLQGYAKKLEEVGK